MSVQGSSVNTHSHSSSLSPDSSTSTSSSSKSVRTPSERSPDAALGGAPSSSAAQQDDARAAQKQDDCKRCETCHGCIHGLLAPRTGIEVVDLWMSAASANNRGLAG
ncbi:hypothetical protein CBOM_04867 [Ceraceosorus bombacis]|uniref:Uncharacterized protein n=1 Tax=Ceraceosorus bombacis TaxID=401625 RepID=A0A0P1BRF6_9BASI|nr:hypothetical protein CBOM_04867 [Ceraceosorus bombacis]